MILKNGKTLQDALGIVSRPKTPTNFLDDRYPFYEIEEYVERMNEAFGISGYRADYQVFPLQVLPNGQCFLSAVCKIEILGKDTENSHYVSGIGTREISKSSSKDIYIGLNNAGRVVQTSAFKSACSELNIFNSVLGNEDENGKEHNGSKQASNEGKKNNTSNVETISFYIPQPIGKMRMDERKNKPVYKAKAHVVVDGNMKKDTVDILFYPSYYEKLSNWQNLYAQLEVAPVRVSMKVATLENKPGTYYFNGL